jgi:hypothetical protein
VILENGIPLFENDLVPPVQKKKKTIYGYKKHLEHVENRIKSRQTHLTMIVLVTKLKRV